MPNNRQPRSPRGIESVNQHIEAALSSIRGRLSAQQESIVRAVLRASIEDDPVTLRLAEHAALQVKTKRNALR